MTGRERRRRANFRLAAVGLVLIIVGLGAIFLWTSYPSPIALVLAMLCIFIGLVLVASGVGLGWFPMMGVEKWEVGNSLATIALTYFLRFSLMAQGFKTFWGRE